MIIWIRAALQLFAVAILSTSSHQVITSSLLLLWYLLSFVYMLSLTLVCIHASVLITVCHPFPSEISGQFKDTSGCLILFLSSFKIHEYSIESTSFCKSDSCCYYFLN